MTALVLFLISNYHLSGLIGVPSIQGLVQSVDGIYPPTNNTYATAVGLPNGVIYLMGGQSADGVTRTDETWMFTTDIRAQPVLMSPMPRPLSQSCAVLVDDSLIFYVAGNTPTTNTGDILRYNTTNDTWTKLVYFYNHRRAHACAYDSKRREILVFFGTSGSNDGNINPIRPERYHVDNNTVNSHPSWPGDFTNHGAGSTAVYDDVTDNIYIMGGEANPTGLTILSQETGWKNGSNLLAAASWGSATIINNEIWYFASTTLQIYNIASDKWRSDQLASPMSPSSSNNAPVHGTNIHLFKSDAHTVLTCALPCPTTNSSCQKSVCNTLTGTCSVTSANNGATCNVDGCTGPDCMCYDGTCTPYSSSADVQPFFECYRPSGSAGKFDAFLSWQNNGDKAAIITAGSTYNQLIGIELPPANQPSFFQPGRSGAYPFNGFFLTWTGEEITWRLSDYELKIDTASPLLLCPQNLSVYVITYGDILTEEDMPALAEAIATRFNFSEERLHLRIVDNSKRGKEGQKLQMDIDQSARSSEPAPQEILNGFINDITNKTNTVTVNEKEVEFNQITGVPPTSSRPGQHVVRTPQENDSSPLIINVPFKSVGQNSDQQTNGSGNSKGINWSFTKIFGGESLSCTFCKPNMEWSTIPAEILLHIFTLTISPEVITKAGLACKNWYRICQDGHLWKYLYMSTLIMPESEILDQSVDWRQKIINRTLIQKNVRSGRCVVRTLATTHRINKYFETWPYEQSSYGDYCLIGWAAVEKQVNPQNPSEIEVERTVSHLINMVTEEATQIRKCTYFLNNYLAQTPTNFYGSNFKRVSAAIRFYPDQDLSSLNFDQGVKFNISGKQKRKIKNYCNDSKYIGFVLGWIACGVIVVDGDTGEVIFSDSKAYARFAMYDNYLSLFPQNEGEPHRVINILTNESIERPASHIPCFMTFNTLVLLKGYQMVLWNFKDNTEVILNTDQMDRRPIAMYNNMWLSFNKQTLSFYDMHDFSLMNSLTLQEFEGPVEASLLSDGRLGLVHNKGCHVVSFEDTEVNAKIRVQVIEATGDIEYCEIYVHELVKFFTEKLNQPAEMMLSQVIDNSKEAQNDERRVLIYAYHNKDSEILQNELATELLKLRATPVEMSMPYQAWKFGGELNSSEKCILNNNTDVFGTAIIVREKKLGGGHWQLVSV